MQFSNVNAEMRECFFEMASTNLSQFAAETSSWLPMCSDTLQLPRKSPVNDSERDPVTFNVRHTSLSAPYSPVTINSATITVMKGSFTINVHRRFFDEEEEDEEDSEGSVDIKSHVRFLSRGLSAAQAAKISK